MSFPRLSMPVPFMMQAYTGVIDRSIENLLSDFTPAMLTEVIRSDENILHRMSTERKRVYLKAYGKEIDLIRRCKNDFIRYFSLENVLFLIGRNRPDLMAVFDVPDPAPQLAWLDRQVADVKRFILGQIGR